MSRIRSPSHPDASLGRAIEIASRLFERIRTNPVDRETAVKEMGYSGMTGASGKMLANLLHFGLVEKAGKGQVRVADLAVRVLHGKSPEEKRRALHQAGLSPEFYQKIRSEWTDGVPTETWLRSLMMREGFSSAAIEPAISSYLETCHFLQQENAYESHGDPLPAPVDSSQIEDDDEDDAMQTNVDTRGSTKLGLRDDSTAKGEAPQAGERVVFREEGAPGQYLKLSAMGEVSDDMLEALEDYVKRQRKRLQRA